jgi:hypothetical protein
MKQRQAVIDLIVSDLKSSDSSMADLFSQNMSIDNYVSSKMQSLGKVMPASDVSSTISALN